MEKICSHFRKSWDVWNQLEGYRRFEHVIAQSLSFIIAIIILLAFISLGHEVFSLVLREFQSPLDHKVFQSVFGMIMTLLIAMEFKHSITNVMERNNHIIQAQTVVLIAQLALARKFIILDIEEIDAMLLAALGFSILMLGLVYWLLREKEEKKVSVIGSSKASDRMD